MKLDAIKQEPKKRVQNILNVLTSYFRKAGYMMLSREEYFWLD
jgi:hypothetical protein